MKKIGIYALDYGGAFNLFVYLKERKIIESNNKFLFFLYGPAKKCKSILNRKQIKIEKNINQLNKCDEIYYALSRYKIIEKKVISIIKKKKIYSILVLDGWGDYKEKMTINKKLFLPNKIIFFDLLAQKIIKNFKFGNKVYLKLHKNLIFNYIKKKYREKKSNEKKLLYLSSPIYKVNKTDKICLKKISSNFNLKLKMRIHPSQNKNKLKRDVIEEFNTSRVVIGHNSSALIYASVLNKETYCLDKNDLYNWKKYGIYDFFKIKKVNTFEELLSGLSKQKKLRDI